MNKVYPLMGKRVEVISEFVRETIGDTYPLEVRYRVKELYLSETWFGWVTGQRYLQEGTVSGRLSKYRDPGFEEPPRLNVHNTVPCLLVVAHPTRNPKRVPLDGVVLVKEL